MYDNNESNEINKLQLLGEATSQARHSNATNIQYPTSNIHPSQLPDPCSLLIAPRSMHPVPGSASLRTWKIESLARRLGLTSDPGAL